jgi:acyl-CoA synthetase (AMP-forming)/AMP-acid ligase II
MGPLPRNPNGKIDRRALVAEWKKNTLGKAPDESPNMDNG